MRYENVAPEPSAYTSVELVQGGQHRVGVYEGVAPAPDEARPQPYENVAPRDAGYAGMPRLALVKECRARNLDYNDVKDNVAALRGLLAAADAVATPWENASSAGAPRRPPVPAPRPARSTGAPPPPPPRTTSLGDRPEATEEEATAPPKPRRAHAVVRGAGPPQGMPPPPPAPSQQAKKEALGRLGGGGGASVPIGAPYEVVDLATAGTGR